MDNTALEISQDRFVALVAGVQEGAPLANVFEAVFEDGEIVELGQGLPIAYVLFLDEEVSELSSRIKHTLPAIVGIEFDLSPSEISGSVKPREKAARLLGALKAQLLSNRRLPGSNPSAAAVDVRYTGGGAVSQVQEGLDNLPALWGFLTFWEIDYRHNTTDPTATV